MPSLPSSGRRKNNEPTQVAKNAATAATSPKKNATAIVDTLGRGLDAVLAGDTGLLYGLCTESSVIVDELCL